MALNDEVENYYQITFKNGRELFLQTSLFSKTETLLNKLEEGTFSSGFLKLCKVNAGSTAQPTYFTKNSIWSIQKVGAGMIGNNTKLWEMVK